MSGNAGRNAATGDAFRSAFENLLATEPAGHGESDVETVFLDHLDTGVGPLIIGATHGAVCLLEFSDLRRLAMQIETLRRTFRARFVRGPNAPLLALRRQLGEYFAGTRKTFDLPLDLRGTPFQKRVWAALLEIDYGETCSYGELATKLGDSRAARAVGTANGLNRVAIVVPCHRVINSGGHLGGYGGGLLRKQFLLDLERGQLLLPTS